MRYLHYPICLHVVVFKLDTKYTFVARYLVKHRENFTFTVPKYFWLFFWNAYLIVFLMNIKRLVDWNVIWLNKTRRDRNGNSLKSAWFWRWCTQIEFVALVNTFHFCSTYVSFSRREEGCVETSDIYSASAVFITRLPCKRSNGCAYIFLSEKHLP